MKRFKILLILMLVLYTTWLPALEDDTVDSRMESAAGRSDEKNQLV